MKFRKKPVVIEAVQWFKPGDDARVYFRKADSNRCWEIAHPDQDGARPVVDSKEGWHFIEPGYWIITGVEGETYGCSPAIFAKTYDPDDGQSPYVGDEARDAARYRWLRDQRPNQLNLSRNDHAANYCTAKQWIEEYSNDWFKDEPQEVLEAMKAADTIWSLQIYPRTPVGFVNWSRATLDELIDAAIRDISGD